MKKLLFLLAISYQLLGVVFNTNAGILKITIVPTDSVTADSCNLSVTTGSIVNVVCNGGNNGSAIATAAGSGPYSYLWSSNAGSQSTAMATGLAAGSYTVTVSNATGCSASSTAIIIQNAPFSSPSVVATSAVHCGHPTGSLTCYPNGGTSPYTYTWLNANYQNTQTISNLFAGIYTVMVTDNCGVTQKASGALTQPPALNGVSIATVAPIPCNGGTGALTASPNGGTSPYTYVWNNSQTTQTVANITAGIYTVMVTDNCGTWQRASSPLVQPAALNGAAIVASAPIHCNGGTGALTATPIGGVAPYTFVWSDANSQATQTVANVTAGIYTVMITDNCAASTSKSSNLTQPAPLTPSIQAISCWGLLANINLFTTGGTPPYSYSWTNGGNSSTENGLTVGIYTVMVTDLYSCAASITIPVNCGEEDGAQYHRHSADKNVKNNSQVQPIDAALYPNPTKGIVTLQWSDDNSQAAVVEVFNMLGEKVYAQSTSNNSQFTIDLSTQPNGVYLYRVITETGDLVGEGRLIIQK